MTEQIREVVRCVPWKYRRHRYLLEVRISESARPRLAVVLKNASIASADRSDPSVGKVEAWARRKGFGAVVYLNLFAFRTPCARELNGHAYRTVVGRENDRWIREGVKDTDLLVCAWGNPNGVDPEKYERRIREVLCLLRGAAVHAVGPLTKVGHPRHGLYWRAAWAPWRWSPNS